MENFREDIRFSVVIPLYNKEESILNTVNSVLRQTVSEFEILVVNDGSMDNSLKVVKSIEDERVRIFDKANGGVSSARNLGIREASNEYIVFLDGDDQWEYDFLATVKRLILKFPEAKIYATAFARVSENKNYGNKNLYLNDLKEGIIDNYFRLVIEGSIMNSSSVCVKKSVFDSVELFDENLSHGEDLDLWIRLEEKFLIAYSPVPKAYYIQDSKDRAMQKMHHPKNSIVYHLNVKDIKDKFQVLYYKKMIFNKISYYIVNKRFRWVILIFRKYKDFINVRQYIRFLFLKYNCKFLGRR